MLIIVRLISGRTRDKFNSMNVFRFCKYNIYKSKSGLRIALAALESKIQPFEIFIKFQPYSTIDFQAFPGILASNCRLISENLMLVVVGRISEHFMLDTVRLVSEYFMLVIVRLISEHFMQFSLSTCIITGSARYPRPNDTLHREILCCLLYTSPSPRD